MLYEYHSNDEIENVEFIREGARNIELDNPFVE